jgi:hypothetical protein
VAGAFGEQVDERLDAHEHVVEFVRDRSSKTSEAGDALGLQQTIFEAKTLALIDGRSSPSSGVETMTNPSTAPLALRSAQMVMNDRLSSSGLRRPPDHEPSSRTAANSSDTSWKGMTAASVFPTSVETLPPNSV